MRIDWVILLPYRKHCNYKNGFDSDRYLINWAIVELQMVSSERRASLSLSLSLANMVRKFSSSLFSEIKMNK